jgi:hypothetical protein
MARAGLLVKACPGNFNKDFGLPFVGYSETTIAILMPGYVRLQR